MITEEDIKTWVGAVVSPAHSDAWRCEPRGALYPVMSSETKEAQRQKDKKGPKAKGKETKEDTYIYT